MEYGKTASGQIMVCYEDRWFWLHPKGWINVTLCDREKTLPISKLEFMIVTGISAERAMRQLKRHCDIIKRRHELFLRAARTGQEFTAQDILGSEIDE